MSEQNSKVNPTETAPLDQISFTQLKNIVFQRKKLIAGITLLFGLCSGGYALLSQPHFRAVGYLKVGHYYTGESSAEPVVDALDVLAEIQSMKNVGKPEVWIESANMFRHYHTIIEIKSLGESKAAAVKIIQDIADRYGVLHEPKLKSALELKNIEMRGLIRELEQLERTPKADFEETMFRIEERLNLLKSFLDPDFDEHFLPKDFSAFGNKKGELPLSVKKIKERQAAAAKKKKSHTVGDLKSSDKLLSTLAPPVVYQQIVQLTKGLEGIKTFVFELETERIPQLKVRIEQLRVLENPAKSATTALIEVNAQESPVQFSLAAFLVSGLLMGLCCGLVVSSCVEVYSQKQRS